MSGRPVHEALFMQTPAIKAKMKWRELNCKTGIILELLGKRISLVEIHDMALPSVRAFCN